MLKHCQTAGHDRTGHAARRLSSPPPLPPQFALCTDTISLSSSSSSRGSSPTLYHLHDISIELDTPDDEIERRRAAADTGTPAALSLSTPSLRPMRPLSAARPVLRPPRPLSLPRRPPPPTLPVRKPPLLLLGSRKCSMTPLASARVGPDRGDRQSPVLVQCRWFSSPVPDKDPGDMLQEEEEGEEGEGEKKGGRREDGRHLQKGASDDGFTEIPLDSMSSHNSLDNAPMGRIEDNENINPAVLFNRQAVSVGGGGSSSSSNSSNSIGQLDNLVNNVVAGGGGKQQATSQPSAKSSYGDTASTNPTPTPKAAKSSGRRPDTTSGQSPVSSVLQKLSRVTSHVSKSTSHIGGVLQGNGGGNNNNSGGRHGNANHNGGGGGSLASDLCNLGDDDRCNIKVYAKCLGPDIEYKTVSVSPGVSSRQLVCLLLSKYRMKHRDPKLFYLTMDVTIRRTGIPIKRTMVLEDDARPAQLRSCNPWGECRFSLQMKKGGLVRIHNSVLMEQSQYKCLLISDDTTVEDVIGILLNCYGLDRLEQVSCFCLFEIGLRKERRLAGEERPLSVQAAWPAGSGQPRLVLRRATRSVSNQVPEETCVDEMDDDSRMDISYSSNESTCSEVAAAFSPQLAAAAASAPIPMSALLSQLPARQAAAAAAAAGRTPGHPLLTAQLSPLALAADMDIDIVKGPSLGSLSSESNLSDHEHFFYI